MSRPPRMLAALGAASALLLLLPPVSASAHRGHPTPTPVVLADSLAAPSTSSCRTARSTSPTAASASSGS
ncbi:hypothetical protein [Phycicoccus sp. HDW14]|uniref:hypothetical protein n=1 Tax=Phycicoccus sp. HDW14 TaxID=2714941 RepID=UPI001F0FEC52|nr:hypothetical protein [Phycicoccus sp. HDW14]